jgi:hypothetical protein
MLDLSHQNLTELPHIPDNETHLDISYNSISKIDKLPSKLVYLNCSFNSLYSLPKLPDTITYINISHNLFRIKPSIKRKVEIFDENNLYNKDDRNMKGFCFDFNLGKFDNLDFYLISSKDNLIIKFKNKYICYNRRDLKFIHINDNLYELEDPLFEGLRFDKKSKNQLKSRYYSLYNILTSGTVGSVIPYRRDDFLLGE